MRQVTGRINQSHASKCVSIRLSSDGHAVSEPLQQLPSTVEQIEWLTPLTLLVPKGCFVAERAADYLAEQGFALQHGMQVVWSGTDEPIVAVMAVPSEAVAPYADTVRHTTPLLHTPTVLQPTLWICDTGHLIYIKVYDPTLQLAEVVAVQGEADRAYLLERLAERVDPDRFVLILDDRAGQRKFYQQRFKKVLCE